MYAHIMHDRYLCCFYIVSIIFQRSGLPIPRLSLVT